MKYEERGKLGQAATFHSRFFFGGYKDDGYGKCGKCGHKHGYGHKHKKCDCKYKKHKPGTCCCKFTLAETIVNYLFFIVIIAVLAVLIFLQLNDVGRSFGRARALSTGTPSAMSLMQWVSEWIWSIVSIIRHHYFT